MNWIRAAVRDRTPGARRAHRAYLNWRYSHRRGAREKLFERADREELGSAEENIERAQAILSWLPGIWNELGIRRLADVPCGELFWMSLIVDRLDYYFGGDVVPEVVEHARSRAPEWCDLEVFDLLTDRLPDVDAIMVRDVLPLLSDRDIATVLDNVCRSSARYLFTTTYPGKPSMDIVTGDFRGLDLTAAPYSLPEPLAMINEDIAWVSPYFADKHLAVWEIQAIRDRTKR